MMKGAWLRTGRAICRTDEAEADRGAAASPAHDEPPRILIVDDIHENRQILRRRFERRGFRVCEAASGREALYEIETKVFDTVLLDIMMPDMDGVEVLENIRRTRSSAELPVIMVTGRCETDDHVNALNLGADDFIAKPVDFAVAMARVKTQLIRRASELKVRQAASEMSYRARHDMLTGLANRTMFLDELAGALDRVRGTDASVGVLFIDLDGFKAVNDTHGHSFGDLLLRRVAQELTRLSPREHLIARLGGDEFAILARGEAQAQDCLALGRSLIAAVSALHEVDNAEVTIGASVGVAFSGTECDTCESLLANADLAMYRAKASGKGVCILFDAVMAEDARQRRRFETDLRKALPSAQFCLRHQPIIALADGRIDSVESVLCWNHPTLGLLDACRFITQAEEMGIVGAVGDWALREACRLAVAREDDAGVAVNVSVRQLTAGNFVAGVMSALAESGLSPRRLMLEVREAALQHDMVRNVTTFGQLRALGVRISLDDFGAGPASLGLLAAFRFDAIKIDGNLMRRALADENATTLCAAMLDVCARLGIPAIAEGVETQEQLAWLRREQCEFAQGHVICDVLDEPHLATWADSRPDLACVPGLAETV